MATPWDLVISVFIFAWILACNCVSCFAFDGDYPEFETSQSDSLHTDFSGLLQSFCTDDDKLLKLQFSWEAWSLNFYTLYCIASTVFLSTPLLNNLFLSITSQRGRVCNTLKFWVTTFRSKSNSTGQLLGENLSPNNRGLTQTDCSHSMTDC